MDFTLEIYTELIKSLIQQGYTFQTFEEYLNSDLKKVVILRHDVDLLPYNSLRFAEIQAELGVKGSYYFRAVPESWNEDVIKGIAKLGHEVGYHYETMDTAKGDIDLAYNQFKYHLNELRKLVNVSTICMHGSPKSKFDNKEIWNKYNYRDLDIIGEPYYDVDFDKMFYLTDTGRKWDGWKTSVRDKVAQQEDWIKQGLVFQSTNDILDSIKSGNFQNKIMFTFHPQRWHNQKIPWLKELIFQNLKNIIKRLFIVK